MSADAEAAVAELRSSLRALRPGMRALVVSWAEADAATFEGQPVAAAVYDAMAAVLRAVVHDLDVEDAERRDDERPAFDAWQRELDDATGVRVVGVELPGDEDEGRGPR